VNENNHRHHNLWCLNNDASDVYGDCHPLQDMGGRQGGSQDNEIKPGMIGLVRFTCGFVSSTVGVLCEIVGIDANKAFVEIVPVAGDGSCAWIPTRDFQIRS